ncbi:DUF6528 family protein [Stackebrandtia nassauensis]|uniref:Uncharacterized protein n=1 Tax=Stackebrandtia nassauensis (strain DSM 44728 / CIP 108903 / NRRL B-16338 / NBRC 102104 / LLR-40K-21) TaxID=446470 RepID=D3Q0K2_STANL|nr:DUF6528 family protein [Stackebrandtia nassauensis]ADD41738.1 hypothetical protein Snas_2043 [Stackebrandtia nassauensis DSM 44728]
MKRRTLLGGIAGAAVVVPTGLWATQSVWADAAPIQIAITEQTNNQVLVFNREELLGQNKRKWSFTPGRANGWGDLYEVRFRATKRFGDVALTASGASKKAGRVAMVKYDPAKKRDANLDDVIWSARVDTYPHSVERIPDSLAVVATGSRYGLHVFAPKNSDPATLKKVQDIKFAKAHEVLWDRKHNLLWAAGAYELRSYQVTGSGYNLRLKQVGKTVKLPYNGHDVQPNFQNPAQITVTDSDGVYTVDRATRAIKTISRTRKIKSYTRLPNGEAMYTVEDNAGPRPWAGDSVYFYKDGKTQKVTRKGAEIYKARYVTTQWT